VAIIAIAIVLVLCAVGAGIWAHTRHEQPAKLAPSPTAQAATNKPALPPRPPVKSTEPSATQMSLAVAHKGEGVESTFIRQFAANPAAYGFNGKDDAKAIHQWAGRQAHLLAIKAGYYDWKFGAEVGAAAPDKMAFVIRKDAAGNLTVVEYAVTVSTTASPTFSQGATHVASATVDTSNFFGASPITGNKLPVPHGEYVYFPGV
jgi:hypothetical protein